MLVLLQCVFMVWETRQRVQPAQSTERTAKPTERAKDGRYNATCNNRKMCLIQVTGAQEGEACT